MKTVIALMVLMLMVLPVAGQEWDRLPALSLEGGQHSYGVMEMSGFRQYCFAARVNYTGEGLEIRRKRVDGSVKRAPIAMRMWQPGGNAPRVVTDDHRVYFDQPSEGGAEYRQVPQSHTWTIYEQNEDNGTEEGIISVCGLAENQTLNVRLRDVDERQGSPYVYGEKGDVLIQISLPPYDECLPLTSVCKYVPH